VRGGQRLVFLQFKGWMYVRMYVLGLKTSVLPTAPFVTAKCASEQEGLYVRAVSYICKYVCKCVYVWNYGWMEVWKYVFMYAIHKYI
jgi:hypothetical protein